LLDDGKKGSQSGRVVEKSGSHRPDIGSGPERKVSSGFVSSQRSEKALTHATLNLLDYDRWLKVLISAMPEYQAMLPIYAPRLLASSTMEGADADITVTGRPVNFMRWLDRFQVTIAYDNYANFKRDVLQRVVEKIKAKISHMSMSEVFSYFDPNDDGRMRITDVANVLRDLDLGFPERQLLQLVYELGFADPAEEVEPVEVLVLLLNALSPFQKRRPSSINSRAQEASKIEAVRSMLQTNKSRVREALGGQVCMSKWVCEKGFC